MLYYRKGAAAHKVVRLSDWLKPICNRQELQGRLIYFHLLFLSIYRKATQWEKCNAI